MAGYKVVGINMDDLIKVLELEKSVADMVQNLKRKIADEIEHTVLNDIKVVSSNIIIVKISKLQRNIWTPEYYIPSIQAKYVSQNLENAVTAHAFIKKVKVMIENRSVKIGSNVHPLNDTTIKILQKYTDGGF